MSQPITDTVLMVRPAHFGFNPQTAESNAFQTPAEADQQAAIAAAAQQEFDGFVATLRAHGIHVILAQDTPEPATPDAIFPNNWVTFHDNGAIVYYPMYAPNRRLERSEAVIDEVLAEHTRIKTIDLTVLEHSEDFLEGTGSMILDRVNKLAYACLSPRTTPFALDQFCEGMKYKPVAFEAVDAQGQAIYHTNVMMALGVDFVVICLASVHRPDERQMLLDHFARTGKTVIDLTFEQLYAFAGNMLQVKSRTTGQPYLVMSSQAYRSLTPDQITLIERHTAILHAPIDTIEKHGGGSARCMLAEVFLPRKA